MNGGDWRDEIIYQVIVDRFANGDINNDHRVTPSALGRYQGGDWQGLIDRLDYFVGPGVTALWIPVPNVKNIDYDAGFDGYHGYWTQSFSKVNPHFWHARQAARARRQSTCPRDEGSSSTSSPTTSGSSSITTSTATANRTKSSLAHRR